MARQSSAVPLVCRVLRDYDPWRGLDVITGNPPYVDYSTSFPYRLTEGQFDTFPTKNIYAFVFERSLKLAGKGASVGLIVQMTIMSSESLHPLQE